MYATTSPSSQLTRRSSQRRCALLAGEPEQRRLVRLGRRRNAEQGGDGRSDLEQVALAALWLQAGCLDEDRNAPVVVVRCVVRRAGLVLADHVAGARDDKQLA